MHNVCLVLGDRGIAKTDDTDVNRCFPTQMTAVGKQALASGRP
jgi:hypothetical protein